MFTGIIKNLGVVKDITDNSLVIKTNDENITKIDLGTSVSVDGVCLTVRYITQDNLEFQISNESKNSVKSIGVPSLAKTAPKKLEAATKTIIKAEISKVLTKASCNFLNVNFL